MFYFNGIYIKEGFFGEEMCIERSWLEYLFG